MGPSAKFIHIDNDTVDAFIKEQFANLRADKNVLATRTPSNPDLRLLVPQLIAGYALGVGYSVIATAAHPKRVIRESYYKIAHDNHAQVVLLKFQVDEEEAIRRIQHANRSDEILDISPHGGSNFRELFEKQRAVLEEPTSNELIACLKVFEINPSNFGEVLSEAIKLATQDAKEATHARN
jgi:hypothetical protein